MKREGMMAVAIVAAAASFQPLPAASVSVIPSTDATFTGIPSEIPDKGANVCVDQLVENPLRLGSPPRKPVHHVRRTHRPRVRHASSSPRPPVHRIHRATVPQVPGEPQHIIHCVYLPPQQPVIESFPVTFARAMSAVQPDNFDTWFQSVIRTRGRPPFATGLGSIAAAAPEPSSWLLLVGGFLLIGAAMRWRLRKGATGGRRTDSRA